MSEEREQDRVDRPDDLIEGGYQPQSLATPPATPPPKPSDARQSAKPTEHASPPPKS